MHLIDRTEIAKKAGRETCMLTFSQTSDHASGGANMVCAVITGPPSTSQMSY